MIENLILLIAATAPAWVTFLVFCICGLLDAWSKDRRKEKERKKFAKIMNEMEEVE